MTQLVKHIEYLLRRHDCVILPGLGALLVVYRPAVINESWALATPPSRTLCFNGAIHHNDGLLTTSVARKEMISYAEAQQIVESEIEDYLTILNTDGELRLGKLGVLKKDSDDCISFNPLQDETFIGLVDIPLPGHSETTVTDDTLPKEMDRYINLRISRRVLKVAACIALVALAALSFILPDDATMKRDYASVLPIEHLTTPIPQQPAVALQETVADDELEDDTDRFFIVVGVFRNIKDCELFISQHPEWASRLQILSAGKNNFKVVADAATDKESLAEHMRTSLQGSEIRSEFPQAWIWERK